MVGAAVVEYFCGVRCGTRLQRNGVFSRCRIGCGTFVVVGVGGYGRSDGRGGGGAVAVMRDCDAGSVTHVRTSIERISFLDHISCMYFRPSSIFSRGSYIF